MKYEKLEALSQIISGQSPPGDTYNSIGKGLPFFQGKSEFGPVSPIAIKWCVAPTKVAKAGDILISVRAPVGPTNLADQDCCIGRGLAAIRVNASLLDRDYLWLYLQHSEEKLAAKGQGSTFDAISGADLRELRIPLRSIVDQQRISEGLNNQLAEVEKAQKAAQAQADDIRLLRERLLNDALMTLDGIPLKVLGDHATTTSGTTPSRSNKNYWTPAEVPWVKTGEVAFEPITQTEEAISRKALAECSLMLLPPKTVLVAMYGQGKTRGQSAILEVEATTNQACFAILPNDTWTPEFLYHWLMINYQNLRTLSDGRGGNQANLNGGMLKALEIPAPRPSEQKEWVQRVQSTLKEVTAMQVATQSTLDELACLPQHLLARAFNDREAP